MSEPELSSDPVDSAEMSRLSSRGVLLDGGLAPLDARALAPNAVGRSGDTDRVACV